MRRFLRPTSLMIVLALLVVGAAGWVFLATRMHDPVPLPVADGDVEVAWLYNATASSNWQRFVQAATEVTDLKFDPEKTFPRQPPAVPEITLPLRHRAGNLRIRWYKLSNGYPMDYWTRALLKRKPPPLAIIGGNNTSNATEQAQLLLEAAASLPEDRRPLLLLTTATADRVSFDRVPHQDGVPLVKVYDERTFRFCFTNRQMADAVTQFIWGQEELRPDAFPIFTVVWDDDPYSRDLTHSFLQSLNPYLHGSGAAAEASDWALLAGVSATGGFPVSPLLHENANARQAIDPSPNSIPFSTGSFERPNRFEAEVALDILDNQVRHQRQRRALLVLSGQTGPSRRLVRAMCRLSPMRTRRFVLASGDTLAFNTVLRDRNVTWPIQDLPCSLVFFCHHNPVGEVKSLEPRDAVGGTEDLYLLKDIVRALVLADGPATANDLGRTLHQLRLSDEGLTLGSTGPFLFDSDGNRHSGSGEHIVWLRPTFAGERALPEATLMVSAWPPERNNWKMALPQTSASTLGLIGSSFGQGPLLSSAGLIAGRPWLQRVVYTGHPAPQP